LYAFNNVICNFSNKILVYILREPGVQLDYSEVHFNTILSKNKELTHELEILDGLENLFDYFALNVQQGEENIIVRDKPAYCRDITQKTQKKPACVDCESVCSFTIEDILSKTNGIGQNDIYAEFSAHFHPRSRLILIANGASRQRSTQEPA
jgi:hypothetical protein